MPLSLMLQDGVVSCTGGCLLVLLLLGLLVLLLPVPPVTSTTTSCCRLHSSVLSQIRLVGSSVRNVADICY